ncbi:MAG TPA: Trp biosynthesis-associated membrane protein [Trebonia sp.]|nr:Trp biosynthesis-associated membrane protein [Trebonia sp.]
MRAIPVRREYGLTLLAGAVGAGLILLAVRERWAEAVFTPPKPLSQQVVGVSGAALVPLAGALAVAALAGLAAVIATRGVLRRAAGVLLAVFGACAGAAVTTGVTAANVVSVAASHVASPESAAVSGAAGSTTSGAAGGAAVVLTGTGHAVMTGTPWRFAVLAGALLVFLAGLATALRGPRWPVMSARYDRPPRGAAGPAADDAPAGRPRDSASMWESLSGGEDPTADDPAGTAPGGRPGAVQARGGGPPQPPAVLAKGGGPPQSPAGLARGDDQSPGMGAPAPMPPGQPPAG